MNEVIEQLRFEDDGGYIPPEPTPQSRLDELLAKYHSRSRHLVILELHELVELLIAEREARFIKGH